MPLSKASMKIVSVIVLFVGIALIVEAILVGPDGTWIGRFGPVALALAGLAIMTVGVVTWRSNSNHR